MAELNAENFHQDMDVTIGKALKAMDRGNTPRTILSHIGKAEQLLAEYGSLGEGAISREEFHAYKDGIKTLYANAINPCIEDVISELEADQPVDSRTRAALRRADKAIQQAGDMATPAQQATLKPLSEKWLNAHPKYAPLFKNQAEMIETLEAGEQLSSEQVAESEKLYADYQKWVNKSRSAPTRDAKQLMEETAQVRANLLEEHAKTWLETQGPYQALAQYEAQIREKFGGGQGLTGDELEQYNHLLEGYGRFAKEEAPGPVTQSLIEGKGADFYSNATALIGRDYQNGLGNDQKLVQKDVLTPSESPAQEAGEQTQGTPATASTVQGAGLTDEELEARLATYARVLDFQQQWIDAAGVLLDRQAQVVSQMPQGHLKATLHAINEASMVLKAEAEKHHVDTIGTVVAETKRNMRNASGEAQNPNLDGPGATTTPAEIPAEVEPRGEFDLGASVQAGEGTTADQIASNLREEGVSAGEPQTEDGPPSPPESTPARQAGQGNGRS